MMNELLKMIGKKQTEKILSHSKFPEGLNDLVRRGYVVVENEQFFLTEKGEHARKTGIQPEVDKESSSQSRRNEMNKSVTEIPSFTSSKNKKSVFFIILTFLIFFIKFISSYKIFKTKDKPQSRKK